MIRVLLAEDQAMVRGALAALLNREQDIKVIAEVARGDAVVEVARTSLPDVALLDIEMPGENGLTAAQALHAALPPCCVVIQRVKITGSQIRRRLLRAQKMITDAVDGLPDGDQGLLVHAAIKSQEAYMR